ncbi:MAG TPA: HK97 family phage prohead protease [Acetobacteraceae bacterium]|nr:HK97 family phage prohead protease [Acetobacteraceae bacterium]
MPELIDIGAFREWAARGRPRQDGATPKVFRVSAGREKVYDDGSRRIRFCFSDGSVDRMGDTIKAAGWRLHDFLKNPVALWAHDSLSPPIGRAGNVLVENERLMGDIEFAAPEVYAFADTIYRLAAAGFVNAVSVGFMPIEWEFSRDKGREFGIDFADQELLEISVVPVPANANALAEARAKGIDTRPLAEWAERVLDGGEKILVPRAELERLQKAASMSTSRRRAAAEDWRCGAARDLPADDKSTWDGPAAAERMLAAAGFNGDDPNPDKAKRGFLVYDAANAKEKGGYKLPFADRIGGELTAIAEGVRAAASRLPQTDIPGAERTIAEAVVKHYEDRLDIKTLRKRAGGMNETDPAAGGFLGECGRKPEEACGMLNPGECKTHGPQTQDEKMTPEVLNEIRELFRSEFKANARRGRARRRDAADGDGAEKVGQALDHLEDAKDLHDEADEHDEKALDCREKAMDLHDKAMDLLGDAAGSIGDPEGGDAAKARRLRRLKRLQAAE